MGRDVEPLEGGKVGAVDAIEIGIDHGSGCQSRLAIGLGQKFVAVSDICACLRIGGDAHNASNTGVESAVVGDLGHASSINSRSLPSVPTGSSPTGVTLSTLTPASFQAPSRSLT